MFQLWYAMRRRLTCSLVVCGGVVSAGQKQRAHEAPEEPLTLASLGRLFKPGRHPPYDPRD